jgi:phosphohistidine phosphatase
MVKRLYLLRHAKAVTADPRADDFARELTVRGMHDAAEMARYLRKNDMRPDVILVSGAARTRQTAELVLREIEARADYRDTLYLAEAGKILAQLQGLPASTASAMVVGHNPGLENLATYLAREPVRRKERVRRDVLEEKFPTAALAVLDFDVARWRDLKPGEGKLADFVRPKDL